MDWRRIRAVYAKDWRELRRSKQAMLPMVLVPLLFALVMPATLLIVANLPATEPLLLDGDVRELLTRLPPQALPAGLGDIARAVYAMLVFMLAPLFLLIPIMTSSIIASISFAGEKERRTIEGLLYTPASDRELVLGKILVALVPAMATAVGSLVVYAVVLNVLGWPLFQRIWFPTATWIALIVWLVPAVSFMSLALVIAVSQRAAGIWEAQQISMLLVLPVLAGIISQAGGTVVISVQAVIILGAVCYALDYALFRWFIAKLDRERIVTRLT